MVAGQSGFGWPRPLTVGANQAAGFLIGWLISRLAVSLGQAASPIRTYTITLDRRHGYGGHK